MPRGSGHPRERRRISGAWILAFGAAIQSVTGNATGGRSRQHFLGPEKMLRLPRTIRITVHDHAVRSVLWPARAKLLSDYPEIKLEIVIDYGLTDIVSERYDAGVRSGEMVAKDMVAVRIGPDMRSAVVGTPSYLAGRSRPKTPQDLTNHTCINLRLPTHGGLYAWEFEKGGRELRVRVEGQLVFNGTAPMLDAALRGSAWRICRRTACRRTSPTRGLSACLPIGVRPTPATTCITPAAANPRRRPHCWSMRCATGGEGYGMLGVTGTWRRGAGAD
jgi:DNA-binding transcriptional LysR family regulator